MSCVLHSPTPYTHAHILSGGDTVFLSSSFTTATTAPRHRLVRTVVGMAVADAGVVAVVVVVVVVVAVMRDNCVQSATVGKQKYLCDLMECSAVVGHGSLGKGGDLG